MRYPTRDELVRMGLAAFALYLGIYYWSSISRMLVTLLGAFAPVLMGCVFAYIINVPMSFFEQRLAWMAERPRLARLRRPISLLISGAIGILIATGMLRFIVPELAQSTRMMSQRIPQLVGTVRMASRDLGLEALVKTPLDQLSDWDNIQMQLVGYLASGASGFTGSAVSGIASALSSTLQVTISAILAIYIVMDKERLGLQLSRIVKTYFGPKLLERLVYVGRVLDHSFSSFIVGRCISSLILGVMCAVGMLALRLPYAATIATVVGVTNIVPVVGPFVGGIIGALLIFSVSSFDAMVFVVFVLALQQIDANVVFPWVVGSSTGLPAMWVLAAVAVGGELGGVPFVLLSVPIAASIYTFVSDDLRRRDVS